MSVWVYPPEYWGSIVRRSVTRALRRGLARISPERALLICSHLLYPIGRAQTTLARRRLTKLLASPIFALNIPRHPQREVMIATIYDYFCPPIISTHTYEDVRRWLEVASFSRLREIPVPTGWFASRDGAPLHPASAADPCG